MMKSTERKPSKIKILESNKTANSIEARGKLLGIENNQYIINSLNNLYRGDVIFKSYYDGISIHYISDTVDVLEVPEVSQLNWQDLILCKSNLCTVKLPKCCPNISLGYLWVSRIDRLFVYDTTEISEGVNRLYSNLQMLIVLSTNGGKPRVYKFSNNLR